jgi:hypothetical protein
MVTRMMVWCCAAWVAALSGPIRVSATELAQATVDKPAPVAWAEIDRLPNAGVRAVEVDDYVPGRYAGQLTPSPPHADLNPRKAIVIYWREHAHRCVFSHEASYCPLLELPSGVAMCNQFFEGNLGDAELFNNLGRKERNSFVDVLESGAQRVRVRWTYFCVNMQDDSQPRLRGTEDYYAYPNGLVLRSARYASLMPDAVVGYSTQPVELFGVAPAGSLLGALFPPDADQGDYHVHAVLDLYGAGRYDIFWSEDGRVRRRGDDDLLAAIARSRGYALVLPLREKLLFAVLGPASGFPPERNQLVDHCTPGAEGGAGWGAGRWDHWPIGWLNSQTSHWQPDSAYAYSFGSVGQFFVPPGKRIRSFWADYSTYCQDMELNRWTEHREVHVLLGTAADWQDIVRIGRSWLDQGAACTTPESVAALR